LTLAASGAIATVCVAAAAEYAPVRRSPSVPAAEPEARVIVKFRSDSTLMRAQAARPGAGPQQARALAARVGLALRDGREMGPRSQLVFASDTDSAALAARLSAEPDVEYAVVDGRKRALAAPNDPLYANGQRNVTPAAGQWYLRAADALFVSAINAENAWAVTPGVASVVVAVLDTGVRPEHPDLQGKLLPGYDFIHEALTANDGDGRDADPSDPGDAVTSSDLGTVPGCASSDIGPASWHGTQTSGLVGAATDNGTGIASIGRNVMVLPLRVLGRCGGYDSDIIDAMRWAAGKTISGVPDNPTPAKVVNMSLGSTGSCSQAYQDAVSELNAAGIVVVASAGNDGLAVGSPANCLGVIAVGGLRHTGTKVGYSDLGPQVAISAPAGNCGNVNGTCMYPLVTTSNSGTYTGPVSSIYTDGDNHVSVGTSFSAPLVAGTAALMFSANPSLTPAQVRSLLAQTARAFPSSGAGAGVGVCTTPTSTAQDSECYCTTGTCGAGMLDAGAAVAAAAAAASGGSGTTPGETTDGNGGGGGGGGGAFDPLWLAGVLLATLALWRMRVSAARPRRSSSSSRSR
jgi:serine protease